MRTIHVALCVLLLASPVAAQSLRDSLTFHASFDGGAKADVALGDPLLYTATTVAREKIEPGLNLNGLQLLSDEGRHGGCLSFTKKTTEVVLFKGAKNIAYAKDRMAGTISFWMQLNPAEDLPPGYVDPLQITDKTWNNASFFVDFTQENPREFRLGVFADYDSWNPDDRQWDDIPQEERPMVVVKELPFSRQKWTHVAITYRDFNTGQDQGVTELFLDGESQGQLVGAQRFSWDPEKVAIMLGINYVGRIDDFAIFNRALNAKEIGDLIKLPAGIKSL